MNNNVSIYYGKKDIDLLSWLILIPKGKYPYYIRQALQAKINNKKIFLGQIVIRENLTPIRKNFNTNSKEIIKLLEDIPFSLRSEYIKNTLREYIHFTIKIKKQNNFIPSMILSSNNIEKKERIKENKSLNNIIADKVYDKPYNEHIVEQNAYNLLNSIIKKD